MQVLSYDDIPNRMYDVPAGIQEHINEQWKGWWAYPWREESTLSLSAILSIVPNVEGRTFLDLGCGSNPIQGGADAPCGNLTYANDRCYPILPLIMQILGAKVMGVDHGDYV